MKYHHELLKILTLMVNDDRLSFVNIRAESVQSSSEKASEKPSILMFDVEFCQKHVTHVEIDAEYSEIPRALFQIYHHHPTRTPDDLRYELMLNTLNCKKGKRTASIGGNVKLKPDFQGEKVRIAFKAARGILNSEHSKVIWSRRSAENTSWEYLDYFSIKIVESENDPVICNL